MALLALGAMSEEDGRIISGWRYPAPYESYRWPTWEAMVRQGLEFADKNIRARQYRSVRDSHGNLVGYIQIFAMDRAMRLGMGLKPDRCGQGLGPELTRLAAEEAARWEPGVEIDLEVEQWNLRAIRAYEKAGFAIVDEYERRAAHGPVAVYCMVWQGEQAAASG